MGFITIFFETSKKHDAIMIVLDKLSKVAHFLIAKSTNFASDIAQIFIKGDSEATWNPQEDCVRKRC